MRDASPTFLRSDPASGNLTNWISGTTNWVYEWDWADRLTKVSSNGVVVLENWYDAASHRIGRAELIGSSTARFVYLYDGWDIVGISSGGNGLYETYTRGVALAGDIGGLVAVTRNPFNQRYYLHNNHRGDVTHVRSGAGTLTTYHYSAFGQLLGTTGPNLSRFKFSSKEHERSCNLYYYGYRFYAPQRQRWISSDPVQEEGGRNLFVFVGQNPLSQVDPDGKAAIIPWILRACGRKAATLESSAGGGPYIPASCNLTSSRTTAAAYGPNATICSYDRTLGGYTDEMSAWTRIPVTYVSLPVSLVQPGLLMHPVASKR